MNYLFKFNKENNVDFKTLINCVLRYIYKCKVLFLHRDRIENVHKIHYMDMSKGSDIINYKLLFIKIEYLGFSCNLVQLLSIQPETPIIVIIPTRISPLQECLRVQPGNTSFQRQYL